MKRFNQFQKVAIFGATIAAVTILNACSSNSTPTTTSLLVEVLPATSNPISNTATAKTLTIDSVLVENNVDAKGKATDDHLEIAVSNTGTTELAGFEVYYTFADPTAGATESYYTKLPAEFTLAAGAKRGIHFDSTGLPDHFPVNKFSLYKTSTNAMDVTVIVSANGASVQTFTLKKDAGGAEAAD